MGSNPTLSAIIGGEAPGQVRPALLEAKRLTTARRIARGAIAVSPGKVVDEGGDLRTLDGAELGLRISVMQSSIVPRGGPRRHRHPHAEVFIVQGGRGRFEIDDAIFNGEPGDVLIVPPGAWHAFTNVGSMPLRLVAVHENPRAVIEWEDGTRRD